MWTQLTKNKQGVIAILTLAGVSAFALSVMLTLSILAIGELRLSNQGGAFEETFYAAEAGLNDALWRINGFTAGTYYIPYEDTNILVNIGIDPDNSFQRIVSSHATASTGEQREVQVIANTSSFGSGFDYAIQGGAGGIVMDNNSKIFGDVYSNGDIRGSNNSEIVGNVWNYYGPSNENRVSNIGHAPQEGIVGDVHAFNIINSHVLGDAYIDSTQTIDPDTVVGGSVLVGTDPGFKDFPIIQTDIDTWRDEITDVVLGNCDDEDLDGDFDWYCVPIGDTLGAQKIGPSGDGSSVGLKMPVNGDLTLAGNVYVSGDIVLINNGTLRIHESVPPGAALVFIAEGIINVENNLNIQSSCTDPLPQCYDEIDNDGDGLEDFPEDPECQTSFDNSESDPNGNLECDPSFVIMISTSTSDDLDEPAVYASNNSTSIVFAAIYGRLKVKNNGFLNAAAALTLHLEERSEVTYNPLLSAFTIPSGGGEAVGTSLGTWVEL
ncbi:MAG: hypothetical protein COT81_03845 [Candidatus Buchananbacteria bacterium CG10_big_fil_rev_8_21_14_0_10_42_9]|uniref:Type 4 fimbrial biogenesis protein PilX N-terminal domain-containing protein n=1 Tax=Candidatus Buchananbacteria bacterium CG10_big_fil_rev_8_21_14_0_10_42_9 TaxID=1974526 RepID=A0A2H0W0Q3_9BACT|nr:MAG: hypothetical protein COT81_03845 [Candidatus Buchananbacteria bacterium CG10_big_fil_rev_8_21_14_0_10_42_9]